MHWTIAASFIDKSRKNEPWLTPFVPGDRHHFNIIPRQEPLQKWHDRKSKVTGFKDWLLYWQQGMEAIKATTGGVITVYPQLAAVVGMQQRIMGKRIPVVAWLFTVGRCYGGIRQKLSQASLQGIDRFVVTTQREKLLYHQWLGLPIERFEVVPYYSPAISVPTEENTVNPFIAALGSAHRDFPTLFQAVEKLNIPTVVASGPSALEGLTIPPNVKTPFGITREECLCLAEQARINVVPLLIKPRMTTAGVITIIEAMSMGRPIIATKDSGAEDYIQHGKTGLLVEPESVSDLVQAIETLWNDSELRNSLGQAAKIYAAENFSLEVIGATMGRILDQVADEVGRH